MSDLVRRCVRSVRYRCLCGVTVSPSRSATISTLEPSGDAAHSYSGAIVRTELLWKSRVRVAVFKSYR